MSGDGTMRAAVCRRYGGPEVVRVEDVPRPVPRDDEVRIRVRAATVASADWRVRSLSAPRGFGAMMRLAFGLRRPRQPIFGTELAGDVDAVGRNVTRLRVGDPVFAFPGAKMGCHAEYRSVQAEGPVVPKPPGMGYEEAAALSFGGTTALHFLRKGEVQAGERVLVNGASGCVGSAVVQLARQRGAEVTGVCSTTNVKLVRSIGAADVIDYTQEDFTRTGQAYDVIVDTVGNAPYRRAQAALAPRGRLLAVIADLPAMLGAPWVSLTTKRKVIASPAPERRDDLEELARLAEAGHFKPVIDRVVPFEEIVAAHRHVETGRKRGSVVLVPGNLE